MHMLKVVVAGSKTYSVRLCEQYVGMRTALSVNGIIPLVYAALVFKTLYGISVTLSSCLAITCQCIPAPYAAEPHW